MEPLKSGIDVGVAGTSGIVSVMSVVNPVLQGVVLSLTILWFGYRFYAASRGKKVD